MVLRELKTPVLRFLGGSGELPPFFLEPQQGLLPCLQPRPVT